MELYPLSLTEYREYILRVDVKYAVQALSIYQEFSAEMFHCKTAPGTELVRLSRRERQSVLVCCAEAHGITIAAPKLEWMPHAHVSDPYPTVEDHEELERWLTDYFTQVREQYAVKRAVARIAK